MKLTLQDIKLLFLSKLNIDKSYKGFLEIIKNIEKPEDINIIKELYSMYEVFFTRVINKEFEENIPSKLQSMIVYLISIITFLIVNSQ